MSYFRKAFSKNFLKIIAVFLVLMQLQSCSIYKKSTTLEQAAQVEQKGFVKVIMVNGDAFIFDALEQTENTFYGIKTENGEIIKTALLQENVLKVERQNKKSSGFFSVTGITVVLVSALLGIFMFGG